MKGEIEVFKVVYKDKAGFWSACAPHHPDIVMPGFVKMRYSTTEYTVATGIGSNALYAFEYIHDARQYARCLNGVSPEDRDYRLFSARGQWAEIPDHGCGDGGQVAGTIYMATLILVKEINYAK